jgi:hypothetical protein
MRNEITDFDAIDQFLLSGRAEFTMHDESKAAHITMKVKQAKGKPIWFVKLLQGPEIYMFLGTLYENAQNQIMFKQGKDSVLSELDPRILYLKAVLMRLNVRRLSKAGQVPAKLERFNAPFPTYFHFLHVGKCGCCGRPLTNPESIATGIGPVCSGRQSNTLSIQMNKNTLL